MASMTQDQTTPAAAGTVTLPADVAARVVDLLDRSDVADVLHRYCACVDRSDMAGLRACVADDIRAKYGNDDWIEGGDTLVGWIDQATVAAIWQHHLISVYSVEVDGDRASALSYHTSHQVFEPDEDVAGVIIARYHDRLVRTADGWKISEKVMEVLWAGERRDPAGRLALIGGRSTDAWS
jgi:hypothetical protein